MDFTVVIEGNWRKILWFVRVLGKTYLVLRIHVKIFVRCFEGEVWTLESHSQEEWFGLCRGFVLVSVEVDPADCFVCDQTFWVAFVRTVGLGPRDWVTPSAGLLKTLRRRREQKSKK